MSIERSLIVTIAILCFQFSSSANGDSSDSNTESIDSGLPCRIQVVRALDIGSTAVSGPQDWNLKSLLGPGYSDESKKTFERLCQAAKNGDSYAQYQLAIVYNKGLYVKKGTLDSFFWFAEAFKRGNSISEKALQALSKNISWSVEQNIGPLAAKLMLNGPDGLIYPNVQHVNGSLNSASYLSISKEEKFSLTLETKGCKFGSSWDCNEIVDIVIFGPNRTITQFQFDIPLKSMIGPNMENISRKVFDLAANKSDISGQYLIFVQLRDVTGPVLGLSQTFWIK